MSTFAGLIDQIAIGLYVILGVVFVWNLQKWSNARYDMQSTTFELERSFARGQGASAAMAIILVIELALIVAGMQRVVVPQAREDDAVREAALAAVNQVVVDGDFITPTRPAPQNVPPVDPVDPDTLGGAPQGDIIATPTNTPTLVGTIEPNAPEVVGCNNDQAFLQIPANGMRVFEAIPVVGLASIPDFSKYTIEIAGPGIPQFAVIDTGTIPVREQGALSQFVPAPYETGTYQFRLMVFDTSDVLRASCQVTVYISDPPLTSTPIPSALPGALPAFSTEVPTESEGDPLAP